MRENLLKALWQDGAYAVNGWVTLPATFSAEIMAQQGWDSLTIDLQHGLIDYQTAVGILQAISTTPTVPLVRVPWLDPAIIMKVLDAGAYGVICPMINSAAEAARLSRPVATHLQVNGVVAQFGRTSMPGRITSPTRIGLLLQWQ
jgi:4-hydroxy-2-oxoheptanedioate aldolase